MTPSLRLALREMRGGIKGFRVFVICLALGVGAIAAVGSISAAVRAGLDADAQRILGGDVSLRMVHREITADQQSWLDETGTLSRTALMRSMAHAPDRDQRSLIELKAIDGLYPLFGAMAFSPEMAISQALEQRGDVWGAAVEQGLLDRLTLAIGQTVRVGDATFEIRAVIKSEPDRLGGARLLNLGPRFMISDAALADTGLVRPGSLVRYLYRLRLLPDALIGEWRSAVTEAFPKAGWRIRDRSDASPSVRRFVDRTTLFLTMLGLTALLIGGVGVGNSVRHYLSRKTATLATLKCLGASSRTLFRVYLIQISTMSAIGILAGIVVGALAPVLLVAALGDSLPVEARIGFYPLPLAVAAAFGALAALAFSLCPLGRACEVTPATLFRSPVAPSRRRPTLGHFASVAAAMVALAALTILSADDRWMAMWFVAGSAGAMITFAIFGRLVTIAARRAGRRRRMTLRLALANLHRPGALTANIVTSLGLGLTVLVAVASIEGNLRHEIEQTLPDRAPGFFFIDIQPDQVAGFETAVRGVDGVDEIRRTPILRGRITRIAGVPVEKVRYSPNVRWMARGDRGLTWAAHPPDASRVIAGEWWPENYNGDPLISLSADAAEGFGITVGDTLTVDILGREVTAKIANLRSVNWRSMRMDFVMIFSPGVIESAPQTVIATVRASQGAETAIERAVTDRFANITAIRIREVLRSVGEMLSRLSSVVRLATAITIVAGALVLAGAIAAGHRRRVYDAVVLKVLGATRRDVLCAYALEYSILGIVTALLAAAIGSIAAWVVVEELMHFDWIFEPVAIGATAAISAVVTLSFGLLGTWRALGHKSAPLLRND
jgi:putative ABC transport system permease protein